MPCQTQEQREDDADRQQHVEGARVRSTQKLPTVLAEARAKPRISATARAMPVAAERKFCTRQPGHLA